jgi:hypothetical protein
MGVFGRATAFLNTPDIPQPVEPSLALESDEFFELAAKYAAIAGRTSWQPHALHRAVSQQQVLGRD